MRPISDAGGSHGWCGSGKLIQQNQSSSASTESSQAIVRSATQSVWYQSRGIGLSFTCGAPVSPPPAALTVERCRRSPSSRCRPPRDGSAASHWRSGASRRRRAWRTRGGRTRGAVRARPSAHRVLGRRLARSGQQVLGEAPERVHEGLEVRLADERGAVAVRVQLGRDRRRVDRQRHAVHPHAVGARVLAGEHGRPRRHADDRLRAPPARSGCPRPRARRSPGSGRACPRCSPSVS